jgi:DNA processing protein
MDGLLPFDFASSHPTPHPAHPASRIGDAEAVAALRLARSRGVGPLTWRRLVERFGGAAAALEAWPSLARQHRIDTRIPTTAEAAA